MTIRYKVVIPFTLLFVVVTAVTAFVSISLLSRSLEHKIRRQIDHASDMLARADFALNASILNKLKPIIDADMITYRTDGMVVASTLSTPEKQPLLRLIQTPTPAAQLFTQGQRLVIRDVRFQGLPYKIAYRPVNIQEGTLIAFVVPTSDIALLRQRVTIILATITVLMVLAVFLVSQLIARSITAPVQRLVEFTRTVAAGDLSQQAVISTRDEIGRLAAAFNDMVRQLRQSEAKLIQSEKLAAVGQLAAGVAHEIRNPLSSLKMHVQLLRNESQDAKQPSSVMLREIDRVEWVVKGLLDLANPGQLQCAPGSINDVCRDTLELTQAKLAHRKIAVETHFEPTIPPLLLDADRLKQAVLNLILNAAEAMPEGGTLAATTSLTRDGTAVTLEICDDGAGIDARIGDRLFDPFVTTKREGVGLGLVNTKSILERHGGTVELVAREGKGTRAIITLPLAAQGC